MTLLCAVMSPLAAGVGCLLLPRGWVGMRVGVALAGPVGALAFLLMLVMSGGASNPAAAEWMPAFHLNVDWLADDYGLVFAFLVAGMGLLITLYGRAYFGADADELGKFYPRLHLFMTAMLGLVLADNLLLMLLFWELTSISSFLLIGWERDEPAAVKKAMAALITTGAGGLLLMLGVILLGVKGGVWSFTELLAGSELLKTVMSGEWGWVIFAMMFGGAAAKSAQWPLHFWLPGAMAAPTPVSAYLHSATMVKAGVYLLGRLQPVWGETLWLWPWVILALGSMTMVVGAYYALRQHDLKLAFAYTTVSQLGLLCCGYGLGYVSYKGQANVIWDVSQILSHAMYKAPLFMLAGAVYHLLGTRNLYELKGLAWQGGAAGVTGRIIGVLLCVGGYVMAAGPMTLSFSSKEFFCYQLWHAYEASHSRWLWVVAGAAVMAGAMNVAIFVRLGVSVFGRPASDGVLAANGHHGIGHGEDHGGGHGHNGGGHGGWGEKFWTAMLWLPSCVLLMAQVAMGLVPGLGQAVLGSIERSANYFKAFPMTWDAHWGVPVGMTLVGVAMGVVLGLSGLWRRESDDPHQGLFPAFYAAATRGGGWVFGLIQTGSYRFYAGCVFGALVLLVVWASVGGRLQGVDVEARMWEAATGGKSWKTMTDDQVGAGVSGLLLAGLTALSAVCLPVVRDRASRVVLLGVVGFCVTGVFYVYRAPDLALTQISIEIVSLMLFLLILGVLPATNVNRPRVLPRLLLAVGVGGAAFWLALLGSTGEPARQFEVAAKDGGSQTVDLGEMFLRNSYNAQDVAWHKGGGGNNVVNVILVDFRGYDTLGEIGVLGIAALGVWTLLRRTRDTESLDDDLAEAKQAGEAGVGGGVR